jgi:hypothetical protein
MTVKDADWPRAQSLHTASVVLTAGRARGCGHGGLVASAAVEPAVGAGLLPQWRARPEASRGIARVLWVQELGSRISLRLSTDKLDQA